MSTVSLDGLTFAANDFNDYGWLDTITVDGTSYIRLLGLFQAGINEFVTRSNNVASAYSATSSSSVAVGTGSKSFTIQTGKTFSVGQPVGILENGATTNSMFGLVTSYDSVTGALVVNVITSKGSGTYTTWTVVVGGIPGVDGSDGYTVLSGNGAPGAGLGVDGDFYIDTTSWAIYGPKASGSWPAGRSLVGPFGGSDLVATSTTSLTIASGNQSLTIQTGKAFAPGHCINIVNAADVSAYMRGTVVSYDSGTGALVVNSQSTAGSGTFSNWSVTFRAASSSVEGILNRQTYTATASQTSFSVTYDVGFVDVWLNGVKLLVGTDFTATTGTEIVLATGATAGDIIDIIAFGIFTVADAVPVSRNVIAGTGLTGGGDLSADRTLNVTYGTTAGTAAEGNDSRIVNALPTTGGTMTGKITLDGDPTNALHAATKQYVDNNSLSRNRIAVTATGTLANGDVVAINADGTVSVVAGAVEATGTASVFNSATTTYNAVASIGTDKVVIAYRDSGNFDQGTAIVGTVSGTSISFGTPVVFESGNTNYIEITYIGSDKVVIAYQDAGNASHGTAIVGTVSGTSISFGTPVVFESAITTWIYVASIGNNKVVVSYRDQENTNFGTAIVGTVSGTSISFGTPVVFESAETTFGSVASVGNDKVVIAYRDSGNFDQGTAIVGTVSGTSISFGTPVVFESANTNLTSVASIGNDKIVVSYMDNTSLNGKSVVGTVSGTSISFGTPVVFEAATVTFASSSYVGYSKVIVAYGDSGNSGFGTAAVGTVSGTTISFDTPFIFESADSGSIAIASPSAGKVVIAYRDVGNSSYGTAIAYQAAFTSAPDWIGVSESAVTDASATIATLGAVVTNQAGLTIGSDYYVADDGSLTTTVTAGRKIGKALSATSLLIEGDA